MVFKPIWLDEIIVLGNAQKRWENQGLILGELQNLDIRENEKESARETKILIVYELWICKKYKKEFQQTY